MTSSGHALDICSLLTGFLYKPIKSLQSLISRKIRTCLEYYSVFEECIEELELENALRADESRKLSFTTTA